MTFPVYHSSARTDIGDSLRRLCIVTPVFDDWESFTLLLQEISSRCKGLCDWLEVVAVDDGSTQGFGLRDISLPAGGAIQCLRVVRLALNLGHQRAIAVGLVTVAERHDIDAVIVMDSDGEDRPEEIPMLVQQARQAIGWAVLAHRKKRSESAAFKTGYAAYKGLFRLLTGRSISFGNFSLLPITAVRRLARMSELWNNLPAAIIRSRLRYRTLPTVRGTRYAGTSKMNLPSLIVHGLSAMSIYTDIIFVRVLMAAGVISLLSLATMLFVVVIRFATDLAIPGWATVIFGDLLIILFQSILLVIATSLMVLASRSARPLVPIVDAPVFIAEITEVNAPLAGHRGVPRYGESLGHPAVAGELVDVAPLSAHVISSGFAV